MPALLARIHPDRQTTDNIMFQAQALIPGKVMWPGTVLTEFEASFLKYFPAKSNLFIRNLRLTTL